MKKTRFVLLISLLVSMALLAGCAGSGSQSGSPASTDTLDTKDELVVGMSLDFPPFETIDADGNPTGIGVDMANDLGKALGKKIRIENMSRSALIPALQTKKVDLIIASMTITEERLQTINFSDPYAHGWMSLLINKNSPVNAVEDLNSAGRKIAVHQGTIAYQYAQKNLPNCEMLLFDDVNTCILEVVQGKADAMIYDQITVYDTWKQNPNTTRVNLAPIDSKMDWGIGIRKEDPKLLEKVNAFLADYKAQGGFDRLSDKYLSEKKQTFKELGLPFFFD